MGTRTTMATATTSSRQFVLLSMFGLMGIGILIHQSSIVSTKVRYKSNNTNFQTNDYNAVSTKTFLSNSSSTTSATIITIVTPVCAPLGNYLSRVARAFALQLWIQRRRRPDLGGIQNTQLMFRGEGDHHEPSQDVVKCFPTLRQAFHYPHPKSKIIDKMVFEQVLMNQQQEWLIQQTNRTDLHNIFQIKGANAIEIDHALSSLEELILHRQTITRVVQQHETNHYGEDDRDRNTTISIPMLTIEGDFAFTDLFADLYYDDFRDYFRFDYDACCSNNAKPDDDESVFHFRNFKREMGPTAAMRMGFLELDANRTANELFGHLQPGDKVAVTSRFSSDASVQPYVDAMTQQRGLKVRVITNQSGVEDFCFLLRAKKELVGGAESTFTLWAGYLGNASKVRLYSIDSPARRGKDSLFKDRVFVHYNWTNPKLQKKVFFELYQDTDDIISKEAEEEARNRQEMNMMRRRRRRTSRNIVELTSGAGFRGEFKIMNSLGAYSSNSIYDT